MRLEDLAAELRPRRSWEAMDLGLRLLQVWVRPIYSLWFATALPLCIIVYSVVLFAAGPIWAAIALWWIKPLLDRAPLHVLSQSLFGVTSNWRNGVREVIQLWRRDAFRALITRRISMSRSFLLPVWQLERLEGNEYNQRCAVLGRAGNDAAHASWLTIICLHLESFLTLALLALLQMAVPQGVDYNVLEAVAGPEPSFWTALITPVIWFIAVSVIEPFYVAAGFALYLNRRGHLEAWDIEVGFRRLAQRIRAMASIGLLPVMLALFTTLAPTESLAQQAADRGSDAESAGSYSLNLGTARRSEEHDAYECIELNDDLAQLDAKSDDVSRWLAEIYRDDRADRCQLTERWVYIPDEEEPEVNSDPSDWAKMIGHIITVIASISELMLWVLAALGLILLLRLLFYGVERWRESHRDEDEPIPEQLFGLDVRPESLPDDPLNEAMILWADEKPRAAISLLYRAALVDLMLRFSLLFRSSATEQECVDLVTIQLSDAALVEAFSQLTHYWEWTAYRATPPVDADFQKMCLQWPFSVKPDDSGDADG